MYGVSCQSMLIKCMLFVSIVENPGRNTIKIVGIPKLRVKVIDKIKDSFKS